MKRIINFFLKTEEQIFKSFVNLWSRYKNVTYVKYIRNGWYYGYFEIGEKRYKPLYT